MRVLRIRKGANNFYEVALLCVDVWLYIISDHIEKNACLDWTARTAWALRFFSFHLTCCDIGCNTVFAAAGSNFSSAAYIYQAYWPGQTIYANTLGLSWAAP